MKHLLLKTLMISGLTALIVLNPAYAHLQTTPTPTMPPVSSITLSDHTNTVTALAWSPDRQL
jgi:hypothetical protein